MCGHVPPPHDAGVGTYHRPHLFPSVPKYFWRTLSCVQVDFGPPNVNAGGNVSFICSLAHCFPRVSICRVACRPANSKMCDYRLAVRTFRRASSTACRHQSVVIERSNRLTITRPDWHRILDILFYSSLWTNKFLFYNEYEGFTCLSKYVLVKKARIVTKNLIFHEAFVSKLISSATFLSFLCIH